MAVRPTPTIKRRVSLNDHHCQHPGRRHGVFPDDTSKDDITSAMKAKFGGPDGQAAPAIDDSTSGIVGNALYRAVNSGTLHGLDYLTAGAHAVERGTGIDPNATDLSQIRSQNDEFASKHPIWAMGADIAPWLVPGYGEALGVGKAAELASSLGAGARTARVLGGAAENAALSGASTLTGGGSVGDALKAATVGGVMGGATGALPAGRTVPTTPTTGDLLAQAQSKFTPLENTKFYPAGFERAMTDTSDAMSAGDRQTMSASLSGKIDDITKETQSGSTLTADDVAKFQRSLMKAARGPQDQRIAGDFIDALDQRLGPVAGDVADANRATNIAKTSRDIDKWAANPETAPKTVAAALAKRPDLYKAQPGLYDALNQIGQLSQPATLMQKLGQHAISSRRWRSNRGWIGLRHGRQPSFRGRSRRTDRRALSAHRRSAARGTDQKQAGGSASSGGDRTGLGSIGVRPAKPQTGGSRWFGETRQPGIERQRRLLGQQPQFIQNTQENEADNRNK